MDKHRKLHRHSFCGLTQATRLCWNRTSDACSSAGDMKWSTVSLTGERRLQETLNSLKSFSSFGDAIWFGLGVRHVLHTLLQTAQGASCVAPTASLTQVQCRSYCSGTLQPCETQKAPAELSLSLVQWKKLAESMRQSLQDVLIQPASSDFVVNDGERARHFV